MGKVQLKSNSLLSELEELERAFEQVRARAVDYQTQEDGAKGKLYDALTEVFQFGELLHSRPDQDGQTVLGAFLDKVNATKPARKNPYLPLVKLAFDGLSASSASQYALVLKHAHTERLAPGSFRAWVAAGIKERHTDAVKHFGSVGHLRAQERKMSVLAAGKAEAEKLQISSAFKMHDAHAPGYIQMLVRIDDQGQCVVVDTLSTKTDALLSRFAPRSAGADPKNGLPLFSFYRAVDLVLGLCPPEVNGEALDLLVECELRNGERICRISAISKAYCFPWASVTIADDFGLTAGGRFQLAGHDAKQFVDHYEKAEWSMAAPSPTGSAKLVSEPAVVGPILLKRAKSLRGYFAPSKSLTDTSPLSLDQADARAFLKFWDEVVLEAYKKANQTRTQPKRVPADLAFERRQDELFLGPPHEPLSAKLFAAPGLKAQPRDRWMGLADIRRLCSMSSRYEIDFRGALVDGTASDVALHLRSALGDDLIELVVPLLVGRDGQYAQTNERFDDARKAA